jgi:hypothetical protein
MRGRPSGLGASICRAARVDRDRLDDVRRVRSACWARRRPSGAPPSTRFLDVSGVPLLACSLSNTEDQNPCAIAAK